MDCTDPRIIRKIKFVCLALLLLLFVIDIALFYMTDWYAHPHFDADKTQIDKYSFLFYPVFGFVGCWLLVVGSKKIFGQVLKRKDTYYHD